MFASKDIFFKSSGTGPYTISRSVRLRSSASAYLNRTFVTPTSTTIWTWSAWVKRGALTGTFRLFGASTTTYLTFNSSDQLNLTINNVSAATSTAVFRDPASWYHIVYQQNGSAQTIYVNNASIATGTTAASIFNTAIAHQLGAANTSNYFDGYLTDVFFIDGQALTPSSFGALNSTSGVWQPKQYTGTYGNNGFYLKFTSYATAAALGTDSSGNGNTWTVNNISVTAGVTYDAMTDVPMLTSATSANYPVWNPLWTGRTNVPTGGNLNYPASSVGIGTMALSGSSYWEITSTGGTSTVALYSTAASTSQTVTTGLTYGFRFNATTGAFDYTTNGSSFTSIATGLTSGPYFFYVSTAAATTASLNAGQQPFTYTPPTGFVALNTYNLSTPTIPNGAAYMAATLYTGNGSTQTIANTVNGVSFQPDFVWIKSRSGAQANGLYDSVRGATLDLISNSNVAETTQTTGLTAFGSTGFTIGALAKLNTNAATYIAWQWYSNGGSSSSNTNGTITSTVSVGATQGFSVVTYTGTGTAGTVGHGLGVAPSIVLVKSRSGTTGWFIYDSTSATPITTVFRLDSTAAQSISAGFWSSIATSSVFGVSTSANMNTNGTSYVAYCFSAVAGFSAVGRYAGNGSTDGPFVYLGFRPRFTLIRRTDAAASNWRIHDTSRDTYNVTSATLYPNLTTAETSATTEYWDILSNGLKLRTVDAESNASGNTYFYMAFAENPFNYALAR